MNVSALDLTNHREFFAPTEFAKGTTYWEGTTKRYWPLSPVQVNFLAIANQNVTTPATDVTWTTTGTQSSEAQSVQVVMADNYAVANQKDFMYALNGNNLSFPTKIDMAFKHAQAYLVFNLKAADEASQNIKITNIELKGVYTSGTATIARTNPGTYADNNTSLTWASRGGTASTAFASVLSNQTAITSPGTALSTGGSEFGHLLIVPNVSANTPSNNGDVELKISYTLDEKPYTYTYKIAAPVYDAGKKYTYDITFKLHEIFIDPSVTEWDGTGNTTNIYLPSIAFAENANVSIGNTEGEYTFTISGLPANGGGTYTFEEAAADSDDLDFIDGAVSIVENETATEGGHITLKFKSTGGVDGKKHVLNLKLGSTQKMKITLNLSNAAVDE